MKCVWALLPLLVLVGCGPAAAPVADAPDVPVVHAPEGSWTNADIDLALYAGAMEIDGSRVTKDEDGMDIRAVSFQTPDSREQVSAHFRSEMARFGDVRDVAKGNVAITSLAVDRPDGTVSKVQITDGPMGGTVFTLMREFPKR